MYLKCLKQNLFCGIGRIYVPEWFHVNNEVQLCATTMQVLIGLMFGMHTVCVSNITNATKKSFYTDKGSLQYIK